MTASRNAHIVGIGESAYAKWGGITHRSEFGLACDAILASCADAGVSPSEIDGFASYANDASLPALVQQAIGARRMRHASLAWGGGGGGLMAAVANAVAAVEMGQAEIVVVYRAIAQGQRGRLGTGGKRGPNANFALPFGLSLPVQQAALVAQRHFHVHGTSEDTLGRIAVAFRHHAHGNPRALMGHKPLGLDGYHAARMISSPLRLFDCCLECDAAAAVLVTTAARARDLARPSVEILAVGQGGGPRWGMGFNRGHNMPDATYSHGNASELSAELFAKAGVAPSDIKVAQFYDAFTPMVVQALGDYGFVDHDDVAGFVASGALSLDGDLPSNTSGGSLSEAYVHGANLLVEAVRQLRGEAVHQVMHADLGFVAAGPGVAPTSAGILAKGVA